MSLTKDHTKNTTKPPSTSARSVRFLGCFGYSGKKNMQLKDKKVNSSSRRRSWLFKLNFSFKKTKVKKVHVDQTIVTKKSKPEKGVLVKSREVKVVENDAKLSTKWADSVRRQNGSFRSRCKETKVVVTEGKDVGDEVVASDKKSVTVLSHSKPLTNSEIIISSVDGKKPMPRSGSGLTKGFRPSSGDELKVVNKTTPFDSMVGMSIILVTLVIMMLWGKLCAILCTCAWFFIAPRLVGHTAIATMEKAWAESHNKLDLESVEYKKKVVLEGLLQRDHRSVVGRPIVGMVV